MKNSPLKHKTLSFLLILLLAATILIPPVAAENTAITFTSLNYDLATEQEILVYDGTGDYITTINTSGSVVLDTDNYSAYLFVFKPSPNTWFANPTNAFELVKVNFGPLVAYGLFLTVVFGLVAVVYGLFFRRR